MAALEEELYEDLDYEEAEGMAAMEDELEMEDLGACPSSGPSDAGTGGVAIAGPALRPLRRPLPGG